MTKEQPSAEDIRKEVRETVEREMKQYINIKPLPKFVKVKVLIEIDEEDE